MIDFYWSYLINITQKINAFYCVQGKGVKGFKRVNLILKGSDVSMNYNSMDTAKY